MTERKKSDSFSSKWMSEKEVSHSLSLKVAEMQRDQFSHQAELQALKQALDEAKSTVRVESSSFREEVEQKLEQQREISTRLHNEVQNLRKEKEELKTTNERFRRQISHVTEEYSQNSSRADELESMNFDLKTQLRTVDDQLKRTSNEKTNLQKSNISLNTQNEQLQQRVKHLTDELRIKQNEASFVMHRQNAMEQQQAYPLQSSYGYTMNQARGSQTLSQGSLGYQPLSNTIDSASPSNHKFAQ
eukprot:115574-Hanusia_phi.AAC.1